MVITLTPENSVFTQNVNPLENDVSYSFNVSMIYKGSKFLANAPFTLLSMGIATEHGIVSNSPAYFQIIGTANINQREIYFSQIPFIPNEYMINENLRIPLILTAPSGYERNIDIRVYASGKLSTLNIPEELHGTEIEMFPFIKIDIDKRAILGGL